MKQVTISDPRVLHGRAITAANADRSLLSSTTSSLSTPESKSNLLPYTLRLFRQIPSPNVVSWTAVISARFNVQFALGHFVSMLRRPTFPNQRTIASLLKTCASLPSLSFSLALHSMSLKLGVSAQPFSGSALIHFYSKCGLPWDARKVLDEIPEKDEVCYGAVVVGLAQNSRPVDAFSRFGEMRRCLDSVLGALRAAGELAVLEQCAHAVVTGLES